MLSITRKADYALIAMADLADQYPSEVRTRDISERRRIPVPVLRKILTMLASRDLVISNQSPTGGFRLARPPADIAIADVIGAIEGSFRFTDCTGASNGRPKRKCLQKRTCAVIGPMQKIHALLEQCLTGVSIEEFATDTVPEAVALKRPTQRTRRKLVGTGARR